MSDSLNPTTLPGAASAATPTPDRKPAPASMAIQLRDIAQLLSIVLMILSLACFAIAAYYILTDMSISSAVKAANAQHTIGLARGLVSPTTCLPVE